jgi:hypothetical protein
LPLHDAADPGRDLTSLEAALDRAERAMDRFAHARRLCPTCGCFTLDPNRPDQRPANLQTRADGEDAPAIERRFSTLGEVAVDETVRTFEGYGVRWGEMNQHREIFMQGAFRATLAKPPTGRKASFYLQHDWNQLIGEWTELREDDTGLFVKGRFVKSAIGDHALALVREKLATGLSIGFTFEKFRTENDDDWQKRVTYHEEVNLYEVSLVERPSDKRAGVTAIRADMSVREVESVLRAVPGMPRDVAKAMASQWKSKGEARDASTDDQGQERDAPAIEAAAREADAATRLLAALTR